MASNYRKIGLELTGDLPWGTHFCHFYRTKEDLIEILVPYFKAGLKNNELCMWITSEPLNVAEAKTSLSKAVRNLDDYINKGQLEILDYSEWYMKSGKFEADNALQGWVEEEKLALEKGFEGLRVSGNTFWLESKDWKAFSEYEAAVESVIRNYRMIVICSYSLDKTGVNEIMDVVKHHQFVLVKREDDWAIAENLERKRMEDALRESEERYRTIFEQAADSIVLIDAETGELVEFNDRAHENLGYSREEFEKLKIPDFEVIESTEEVVKHIKKVVKEGSDVFETQHGTKDGEIRDIRVSSRAICVRKKKFIQSIWRDITEHKRAEEALKESEERYRALVNLGGGVGEAIIMRQDTEQGEGIQTFVSDEWPRITGYSRKELLGMSFFDLLHPKHREASLERYKRRMGGEVVSGLFEMSIIRKDGTEVPIELTSAYTTYKGERANVAFIRDITERRRAEEKIRGLAKFPSENPNPVLRVAKDGTILYANQAASPLLNEWRCQTGQLAPDYLSQSILEVLGSGSPKYIEVKCGEQTFSFMFSPIVDAGYVNLYGRDITERKQAEEREKEMQQELNLSSRLASVGELAAGVAHEMNNPLTGILGFSERLLRKSTEKEISRGLEKIHSEATRAARVVQNLRTFARRREPSKEYSNVNNIVRRALELRAYELKTGNIEVVTDLTPRLPKAMVDFYQIQDVFLNIILNAEQAMTEANGGGKLCIKTGEVEGSIRASFTDDGPGIPADQLGKVFDPFFTTRGEKGGTGLGLSVCHGIVTEHGGKIYAKSKAGKGATFFVELPLPTEG